MILATGGMGQVYRSTTNPTVSTGDGAGLALRAGARRTCGWTGGGEVASSGVHGANRLASNSLLEGLLFSRRIVAALEADPPVSGTPLEPEDDAGVLDAAAVPEPQEIMTAGVGVLRDRERLDAAEQKVAAVASPGRHRVGDWQATNLLTTAAAVALAAGQRHETRGSHRRDDYSDRDDRAWSGHLETTLRGGTLHTILVGAELTDG